jgi:PadR family transcriptional regulator, regulatory protein PadR
LVVRACTATTDHLRARLIAMVGERPGHGYELCHRLRWGDRTSPDTVAVYRALRRLERDGLVESRWDQPFSGPARRIYSLTTP